MERGFALNLRGYTGDKLVGALALALGYAGKLIPKCGIEAALNDASVQTSLDWIGVLFVLRKEKTSV